MLFYAAAVTFPIVVTIASWSFLHPLDSSSNSGAWSRTLILFVTVNIHIVNAVIALAEILVLSSVRKQRVGSFLRPSIRLIGPAVEDPRFDHRPLLAVPRLGSCLVFGHGSVCLSIFRSRRSRKTRVDCGVYVFRIAFCFCVFGGTGIAWREGNAGWEGGGQKRRSLMY